MFNMQLQMTIMNFFSVNNPDCAEPSHFVTLPLLQLKARHECTFLI